MLYSETSIEVDLRQALRDSDSPSPCEEGLRSICWKVRVVIEAVSVLVSDSCHQAFLLYGPLNQASWPRKLSDSRSAYSSLRDHFLKYIDHPDDLQSTIDPLADDDNVCCALSHVLLKSDI